MILSIQWDDSVLLSCPSFLYGKKYHGGSEITKIHREYTKDKESRSTLRITTNTANYFNSKGYSPQNPTHSVLKLLTGLAMAALIAWKLIVIIAITVAVV